MEPIKIVWKMQLPGERNEGADFLPPPHHNFLCWLDYFGSRLLLFRVVSCFLYFFLLLPSLQSKSHFTSIPILPLYNELLSMRKTLLPPFVNQSPLDFLVYAIL